MVTGFPSEAAAVATRVAPRCFDYELNRERGNRVNVDFTRKSRLSDAKRGGWENCAAGAARGERRREHRCDRCSLLG